VTRRTERIGEQIRAELARLLVEEATDPRLRGVTFTRVEVTPDLSLARVAWSAIPVDGAPPAAEVQRALDHAAGFLRHGLAHALSLRRTPELRFRHDDALALGNRTLAALHALERDDEEES
jgi:ribosome-binding factor A